LKKYSDDVAREDMEVDGLTVKGVKIQWLFSKREGTRDITMRKFTMDSTTTPNHRHPWEHIIYILRGKGKIKIKEEWLDAEKDDVFFIPEDTPHGYSCEELFVFICVIPNIGDTRK